MSSEGGDDRERQRASQDQSMENAVGILLRTGVLAAGAITLVGGILYLARHGGEHLSYTVFRGEPQDMRSPGGILASLPSFQAQSLIQFGLLVLIATPVLRVLLSVVAFARERDLLYTVVTLIVLAILGLSLFGVVR
jgi:uncharacterized membrane protein